MSIKIEDFVQFPADENIIEMLGNEATAGRATDMVNDSPFINERMISAGLTHIRVDRFGGVLFVGEALSQQDMQELVQIAEDEGKEWCVVESFPKLTEDAAKQKRYIDEIEDIDQYSEVAYELMKTLLSVHAGAVVVNDVGKERIERVSRERKQHSKNN